MRIYYALVGYEELAVSAKHAACFLSLCRSTGWVYQPLAPSDGEWMIVRCTLSVASCLRPACVGRGIIVRTIARGGLPVLLTRYRSRVGIVVGLLLAILLMRAGSGVLWDIRVRGNAVLSKEAVIEQLAASGLSVGERLGEEIDTREIENRLLRASPDIAWISVNLRGTVAEVQIREIQKEQSAVSSDKVNLVAAADGTVRSIRLLSGEAVVSAGQQVRAGELLISGVRDSSVHGFDVVGARGEVMAQTEHQKIVQIPLTVEEKVYTGEEKCEKSLFFFGKSIKFSKSTGIIGGSCDTIYTMEKWALPTGHALPLGWETVRYRPYGIKVRTRSQREAYALAMAELEQHLRGCADDALLLHKSVQVSYSDTYCTLVCDYTCLQNIAVPSPLLDAPG